jgi:hypothetical protein
MYNREYYQRLAINQNFEGSHTCITLNAIPFWFLIMQHELVFIAAKGLTPTKLWKVIIC